MAAGKSDKAWYWLACGVLALGITNNLATRHVDLPSRLADRASQVADRLSGRFASDLERVAWVLGSKSARVTDRAQLAVDRSQARLDCLSAQLDRHQAEMERLQAQAGELAITRMNVRVSDSAAIVCPRSRVERRVTKIVVSDDGHI